MPVVGMILCYMLPSEGTLLDKTLVDRAVGMAGLGLDPLEFEGIKIPYPYFSGKCP